MKIEKFLNWILDKMLNYPDISFCTVKIFIDKFNSCLSKRERERWCLPIQMIKEFTSKQITIDTFVNNAKVKNLSKELKKLKGVDNNKKN